MFPNRFLPAPVPTGLEKNGRIIPEKKSGKAEDTFVENLWHRMAIDNLVAVTEFKELPYDYYCPSVKNVADRYVLHVVYIILVKLLWIVTGGDSAV